MEYSPKKNSKITTHKIKLRKEYIKPFWLDSWLLGRFGRFGAVAFD